MEDSGFKVYKNFKTSQYIIDIYAVLSTNFGDFGVVVECNNYDKDFPVSIEIIKHMEKIAESIKASKIVIVSSSFFKRKNVISLIFSFAMLGIIGYFALSAMQSGDESSIGVTLAKQITGLYPISTTIFQCTVEWDFI